MTILDKLKDDDANGTEEKKREPEKPETGKKEKPSPSSSESQLLSGVESQFAHLMEEFNANAGFRVDTGEQPYDTMIELLSSKGVNASIAVLLSFIRYCINHNIKKDITVKIGYNKPPSIPMNFAINEELLDEIYPGDVVEIN